MQHSVFIVHKSVKDWFNQQADDMGNDGLAISSLCLSKSGKEPGSHGWCGVSLSDTAKAEVEALLAANPKEAKGIDWTQYDLGTNPEWPQTRLGQTGLKLIVKPFRP